MAHTGANPATWPQANESVQVTIEAGAMVDAFGNVAAGFGTTETWAPAKIFHDSGEPRLEEICYSGETLVLGFSEAVDPALAGQAFTLDASNVGWQAEDGGYRLTYDVGSGSHLLLSTGSDLDLFGNGLAGALEQAINVEDGKAKEFLNLFPGEDDESRIGNVFGFKGLPHDPETGFIYTRNRYYDPELGRFITTDPMGYADGPNMYQFALNNPASYSDPTGEIVPCLIAGAASVAIGAALEYSIGDEDYDLADGFVDFAVGILSCGFASYIGASARIATTGGKLALTAGSDLALTIGGEAFRSQMHGEEITARGLFRTDIIAGLFGTVPSVARELGRAGSRLSKLDPGVTNTGVPALDKLCCRFAQF